MTQQGRHAGAPPFALPPTLPARRPPPPDRPLTARGRYGQILRSFGGIDTSQPGDSMAPRYAASYRAPQRGPARLGRAELVDGAKALSCLAYQCAEGNVPESGLFQELEAAIGAVCKEIVSSLPEYESAAWG